MIYIDIEVKRNEMHLMAGKYGMTSKKTVQCSQELDVLLNCLESHRYRKTDK
ncbi:aspartyl-phosphate phosphatase Spo0E family protein [Shouchella clausii]|jgi:hypothetical protein|uniref:Aspartyl-phosphate phosphatase Spo0E family protein n=2 Tax=Shouchella TaxID=2893057 RepID=A0A268S296_SHOCL|nr:MULTISPECIES: aspartyl-phosphate phosphatase Spo0E family protein [Shouchella]MCM3312806.1 aspartyl-phosphate phosphatase Spo0E family protein [Psychrobacillus sp. MER TA 17]PAD41857.1 aspartyl-phosphate phosphatase Spo0E family protein [Bacillus sp. 7520-S]SPU21352.1 stage 0 sporulation regulatory protein [Niallia circulans]ALA55165.1 hypothetical protein DB29_04337 [Shouchella clausii]AST97742.1 hypothetical protein BC8716_17980 [Shouchella clausii]